MLGRMLLMNDIDGSYVNKRNVKSWESIKYELRRCERETIEKISKDLEDADRRHNSKLMYCHVNKLRGSNQSEFIQLNIEIGTQLVIRNELKWDGQNILRIC